MEGHHVPFRGSWFEWEKSALHFGYNQGIIGIGRRVLFTGPGPSTKATFSAFRS